MRFRGEFLFLSNFYRSQVSYGGRLYPTVEHAYQAAKTSNPDDRLAIALAATPGDAKKMGRYVTLRSDWESIKLEVMEALLREKFRDPKLREKLVATRPQPIVEDNTWGDVLWGVYEGKGKNHLGKLLMKIREEAR